MAVVKDQKKIKKSPEGGGGALPSSCIHHRRCRHLRARGAINPRGADTGLGLGAEGEVLCLKLCPALGETLLMLRMVNQTHPSPGTFISGFCRLSCLLLPQPGTPAGGFSAPKPSLHRRAGRFVGSGTFCCGCWLPSRFPCFVEQLWCKLHPSADWEGNEGMGSCLVPCAEPLAPR